MRREIPCVARRGATALAFALSFSALNVAVSGAESPPSRPAPVADRLAAVRAFCDLLLERGRDDYGPRKLRLWPNAYDIDRRSVPMPDPAKPWPGQVAGHAPFGCNLQQQASLLRLLWAMTDVTGDPKYRTAVRDGLRDYFDHAVDPRTGAFPWGTHCSYDVTADTVFSRGRVAVIEEKQADIPWEILHAVDARATLRAIDHMRLSYDREFTTFFQHRLIDQTEPRSPAFDFGTDDATGNHPTTMSIVVHLKGWAFAHSVTRDPKYLGWIERAAAITLEPLEPGTGLVTELANLRRHRHWPDTANEWERRSVMIKHGDPYLWGYYMFKLADVLPPGRLPALAVSGEQQLARWPQAAWDPAARLYRQNFPIYPPENARAVTRSHAQRSTTPRHGSFWDAVPGRQGCLQMVTAYLAYANAYRRTGNPAHLATVEHLHGVYVDEATFPESEQPDFALPLAIYIQANAEALERSGDERYRTRGRRAIDKAFRDFWRDGFFLGQRRSRVMSHGYGSDDLAAAILRFHFTDRGLASPLEDAYLYDWGYTYP
jgi:hypothetical protein